jgi:ketosteroid isomerase-like protein
MTHARTPLRSPSGGQDANRRQLQDALRETDIAIRAITSGDPQPYIALWDDSPDVTLFGAWGPIERGPDALRDTFTWVAGRFGPEGGLTSEPTVVDMSGSLAYAVGFERGEVQVDGGPLVPMTIRVTHVYRHTRGRWRLMHRHADFPPADGRSRGGDGSAGAEG